MEKQFNGLIISAGLLECNKEKDVLGSPLRPVFVFVTETVS